MQNTTIQEAMAALDGEDGRLPYHEWVAPNPSVDFLRLEYFSDNTTASYRLSILANTNVTRQAAIIHQGRIHVLDKIMNVNQPDLTTSSYFQLRTNHLDSQQSLSAGRSN